MQITWLAQRDWQNPLAGGAERTQSNLARGFSERGHDVTIIASRWPGAESRLRMRGVTVIRIGGPLGTRASVLRVAGRSLQGTVVVEDLAHVVPWGARWVSDRPTTAFFHHLHLRTLSGQVPALTATAVGQVERLYPMLFRNVPFVTESEESQRDLHSLGIPDSSIIRIPPGVDSRFFRPGKRSSEPTVLYFGGMRPYKRPEAALLAFQRVRERVPHARMRVVGDGPSVPNLCRLARTLGLLDAVEFTGRVDDERLSEIIRESWVNVHCSVAEGWCLSALEAAASGVATVAFRVPGIRETVIEGKTGLLVEDGDVAAMAGALLQVLKDPSVWRENTRAHAENYSWGLAIERWEAHLSRTLEMTKA